MTAQVEFHYDFGSPHCYFSHLVNKSPMEQFKEIPLKMDYMRLETKRFIEAHNLTKFHMNPNFPVNTVQIMRGALAAEKEGCADRYIDAVFTAMWEDGKKMDDPGVIQDVLNDAGLDAEKIMARTQDQDIKDTLINYTNSSVERGCFGAPMFFVGDEMFFGKDRLDTVEQEILNQK